MKTPHMKEAELVLFKNTIQNTSNYFEFGVGGSTRFVYDETLATIRGVDSSKEWVGKVSKHICSDRVSLHCVNIGEVREWGFPRNEDYKHEWPNYSLYIKKTDITPDTILVDGRFRVACLIQSILFSIERDIDPTIILHDSNRDYYTPGTRALTCIDRAETLSIFKINRDNICLYELRNTWCEFKFNYE